MGNLVFLEANFFLISKTSFFVERVIWLAGLKVTAFS